MRPHYDKFPTIAVPASGGSCVEGWEDCACRLRQAIEKRGSRRTILVVECYPSVHEQDLIGNLQRHLSPVLTLNAATAMLLPAEVDALVAPFLGGDDPVFGFLSGLTLPQFFDRARLAHLRHQLAGIQDGLVFIVGCGARLVTEGDILVYADLARYE